MGGAGGVRLSFWYKMVVRGLGLTRNDSIPFLEGSSLLYSRAAGEAEMFCVLLPVSKQLLSVYYKPRDAHWYATHS